MTSSIKKDKTKFRLVKTPTDRGKTKFRLVNKQNDRGKTKKT